MMDMVTSRVFEHFDVNARMEHTVVFVLATSNNIVFLKCLGKEDDEIFFCDLPSEHIRPTIVAWMKIRLHTTKILSISIRFRAISKGFSIV